MGTIAAEPHLAVSLQPSRNGGDELSLALELQDWHSNGPHQMANVPWQQLSADPQLTTDGFIEPDVSLAAGLAQQQLPVPAPHAHGSSPAFQPVPASCFLHDDFNVEGLHTAVYGLPTASGSSGSPASTGFSSDWDLTLAASITGPTENLWDDKLDAVAPEGPWDLGAPLAMELDLLEPLDSAEGDFADEEMEVKQEGTLEGPQGGPVDPDAQEMEVLLTDIPRVQVVLHVSQPVPQQAPQMVPEKSKKRVKKEEPQEHIAAVVHQVVGRREARRKASLNRMVFSEDFTTTDDDEEEYCLPAPKRSKGGARGARKGPQTRDPSADSFAEAEPSLSTSSDGDGKKRRKQHNPWNLEETEVLIEGVEKCGGGRWADIKKLGYAAIERRSPVDLKDKWRNLIRVACQTPQQAARTKCDKRREIPDELLARVRAVVESTGGQSSRKSSHRGQ